MGVSSYCIVWKSCYVAQTGKISLCVCVSECTCVACVRTPMWLGDSLKFSFCHAGAKDETQGGRCGGEHVSTLSHLSSLECRVLILPAADIWGLILGNSPVHLGLLMTIPGLYLVKAGRCLLQVSARPCLQTLPVSC